MVVDQMPPSSFVIFRLVPLSQLPLSVTSVAFGARRRNVTVRSGWISGERNAGRAAAAGGAAVGGCCAASDAPMTNPIAAIPDRHAHLGIFIEASLESYFRRKLQLAHRHCRSRLVDGAERAAARRRDAVRAGDVPIALRHIRVRVAEIRAVQQIEGFNPKLHAAG